MLCNLCIYFEFFKNLILTKLINYYIISLRIIMGIFEKLLNGIKFIGSEKEEKKISVEEAKFNSLDLAQQKIYINEILKKDDKKLLKYIETKPYILPHIMDKIENRDFVSYIDIATKKGVNILDLLGKNPNINDKLIVNIGVMNDPDLIFSSKLPKKYKDMVSAEILIQLFLSNPAVVLSDCAELQTSIKVKGVRKDGKEQVRAVSLKSQLLRAINLYMRPESYKDNGFDKYAKIIANQINGPVFLKNLEKITSTLTTAANEVLTKMPEKAKSSSSSALHNWNNRVAHKLPKLAKSDLKKSKVLQASKAKVVREKWYKLLCGLLSNPSINSFSKEEKISLVKDCVTALPEIYYELAALELKDIAKETSIQLYTYETFKKLKMEDSAEGLLDYIGEEQKKKVISRSKANQTRKANAKKKSSKKEEPTEAVMNFDRNKY